MCDELDIAVDGRFQMPAGDLAGFAAYPRENGVPCDVDEAEAFVADGRPYGLGRLHHPYDIEAARDLYRSWERGAVA
jgi:hypothetical protein